jgi:hypothetical protein
MTKTRTSRTLFLVAALLCGYSTQAASQTPADSLPTRAVVHVDSSFVVAPLGDSVPSTRRFEENTARPLSTYLSVNATRLCGYEWREMSRFECAIEGVDVGLTCGLVAGAAGMMSGAWDEPTAWYIAGAAAMVGALFGGTVKADDPRFRVRLRWEPSERDPWGRSRLSAPSESQDGGRQ